MKDGLIMKDGLVIIESHVYGSNKQHIAFTDNSMKIWISSCIM